MAPHLYQSALLHEQPEPKFLDVLQLLDFTGTRALLEDDEMRRLLVPTLRADFEAVATYGRDFSRRAPLSCPITGFAAKHPNLELSVLTRNSHDAITLLARGEAEL